MYRYENLKNGQFVLLDTFEVDKETTPCVFHSEDKKLCFIINDKLY